MTRCPNWRPHGEEPVGLLGLRCVTLLARDGLVFAAGQTAEIFR
jgi:hypothetical protein